MFEVFRCARKANGPAVRLGHSVGNQARRAPDNAGPLNFHSPTQKRAGRYPGNVFRLHPISLTGRAVCGHIPAFSGRDIYRADPLACHRFPTPPLLCSPCSYPARGLGSATNSPELPKLPLSRKHRGRRTARVTGTTPALSLSASCFRQRMQKLFRVADA